MKRIDSRLARIIAEYQETVAHAVSLIEESGISRPTSSTAWLDVDIPVPAILANGVKLYKHGVGCAVHLPEGSIDFDFGDLGEITGFNANRLVSFAAWRLHDYGFVSKEQLIKAFDVGVQNGFILDRGEVLSYLSDVVDGHRVPQQKLLALTVTNAEKTAVQLVVEPWATEHKVEPEESLHVIVSNPALVPMVELESRSSRLTIAVKTGGSLYEVWKNGIQID